MRKVLLLSALSYAMLSCGGGTGGGISATFDTVAVSLSQLIPLNVQSDVIIILDPDQNRTDEPCAISFQADAINVKIKSETIKNAAGQPVPPNPSPVVFYSYRVTYTPTNTDRNACEQNTDCRNLLRGGYSGNTYIFVSPDSEVEYQGLQITSADWKRTLANYCIGAGSYCTYSAVIELIGRETMSGRDKVIKGFFNIDFSNYDQGNACGAGGCAEDTGIPGVNCQ